MTKRWLWVLAAALVQIPSPSLAQVSAPPDEMAQLAFLIGDWQGSGWILVSETRHSFTQTEHVEAHADGAILAIDGVGESTDAANSGTTIHRAYGTVSYDVNAGLFRWYSVESSGQQIITEANVSEQRLIWSAPAAGGGVDRYTITLDERGRWHEIGERSQDGCRWQQFFEMTLDPVE